MRLWLTEGCEALLTEYRMEGGQPSTRAGKIPMDNESESALLGAVKPLSHGVAAVIGSLS